MKYYVSRQIYWPDGTAVVEIASGGVDFANADMLVPKFLSLGEGVEYEDPRAAVEAAVQVCAAWNKVRADDEQASIAYGSTGGFTMPFEPCTEEEAVAWAEKAWEKLPKCGECGEALGKTTYSGDHSDDRFCSSSCYDKNLATVEELNTVHLLTTMNTRRCDARSDGEMNADINFVTCHDCLDEHERDIDED